ncbi:hypothetical protein ABFS82_14G239700 [Erythranthe guttata]
MAKSTVSMKLLIDTHAKRVLFAEADNDCVDFLFYILSLPVANLVNLVGKNQMVGSLGNLYESIENMNDSYVQPNKTKLKAHCLWWFYCGFVKGVVTYMVMDDLVVTPMSTISSITLLNKFNIKEVGSLQEKVVDLGMAEAVKLLKAALESDKVLTSVFLK